MNNDTNLNQKDMNENINENMDENKNMNENMNKNINENKNKNNIFSNPIHGKNGQDKQLEEIKKNNEIINEFVNDIFYYFWNFFDNTKK